MFSRTINRTNKERQKNKGWRGKTTSAKPVCHGDGPMGDGLHSFCVAMRLCLLPCKMILRVQVSWHCQCQPPSSLRGHIRTPVCGFGLVRVVCRILLRFRAPHNHKRDPHCPRTTTKPCDIYRYVYIYVYVYINRPSSAFVRRDSLWPSVDHHWTIYIL